MIVLAQASTELPLWVYIIALLLGNITGIGLLWWRKRRKHSPTNHQE